MTLRFQAFTMASTRWSSKVPLLDFVVHAGLHGAVGRSWKDGAAPSSECGLRGSAGWACGVARWGAPCLEASGDAALGGRPCLGLGVTGEPCQSARLAFRRTGGRYQLAMFT